MLRSRSALAASDNEDDEDMLGDQDEQDEGMNVTIMFSLLYLLVCTKSAKPELN